MPYALEDDGETIIQHQVHRPLVPSYQSLVGFRGDSGVKNLPINAGDAEDAASIPGLGRSPGGGNGNLLHYSCLKNPMDRGPGGLQSMGSQSQTQRSD